MKINKFIPVNRPVIGLYEKKFLLDAFNKNQLTLNNDGSIFGIHGRILLNGVMTG